MKQLFTFVCITIGSNFTFAERVIDIHVGNDYSKYSNSELRRRVYDLERAVWQLQRKVYELDNANSGGDQWVCTVKAMGDSYTATGGSKAVATHNVMEKCKAARGGDGFFCKNPTCEK